MHGLEAQQVLREVELAIDEKNYGRLYDLGINLVKKSANEDSWLKAVVIISGYLVKSKAHLWDAMELSKRAALQAPETSTLHEMTAKSLLICINAFPDVEDRIKASHSVVTVAPTSSKLILICLNVMLNNISEINDMTKRKQYIRMAIFYAPKNSPMIKRAQQMITRVHSELDIKTKANTDKKPADNSPLLGFIDRHQNNVAELFHQRDKRT